MKSAPKDQPLVWINNLRCPACGSNNTLFVASGGYVTCSWVECPNPDYADALEATHHTQAKENAGPSVDCGLVNPFCAYEGHCIGHDAAQPKEEAHKALDEWLADGNPVYYHNDPLVLDLGIRFKRALEDAKRTKTTIQAVVNGTPQGQQAVQSAMERSAAVMETTHPSQAKQEVHAMDVSALGISILNSSPNNASATPAVQSQPDELDIAKELADKWFAERKHTENGRWQECYDYAKQLLAQQMQAAQLEILTHIENMPRVPVEVMHYIQEQKRRG